MPSNVRSKALIFGSQSDEIRSEWIIAAKKTRKIHLIGQNDVFHRVESALGIPGTFFTP